MHKVDKLGRERAVTSGAKRERHMGWREYVAKVSRGDKQSEVARKTGIDQTTISRWLSSSSARSERRISSQAVRAFAHGYNRPVLEAFVAADFLTPEEAGLQIDVDALRSTDLSEVDADELVRELRRRMTS
jgi:transcriptional regulator with XRE-family HTH domain